MRGRPAPPGVRRRGGPSHCQGRSSTAGVRRSGGPAYAGPADGRAGGRAGGRARNHPSHAGYVGLWLPMAGSGADGAL
ncbi:hypothetical protein [Kribbella catacumbae]|uniref:hypothetical protein n=1 Tax=Kribbella catacumbae TaxID=460086 RepID=UPI0003A7B00C|nr:hypothetical protein [Kribbella catacumbae]